MSLDDPVALALKHYDAGALPALRESLLDVYRDCYADRLDDPFFTPDRYWQRLEAYAARDGFDLVIGQVGADAAGYTLGYTLPAGSGWWNGLKTDTDPNDIREDGKRTFALNELMVRPSLRGHGYGHRLHDAILADRPEQRATLLVRPDNVPAQPAYLRWGWQKLGELQPFDDAPRYDAMIIKLHG